MTGIRRRSPTNKEFKTNFQGLAATKTKKGHLDSQQEKKASDNAKEVGTLIRITKDKLYENGWEVQVGSGSGAKTYMCSYQDGVLYIPPFTETDKYYVMKEKVEVEISIDKQTKVYNITKINTLNKKPLALYNEKLTISTNTNTNTNSNVETSIEVSNNSVEINSDNIIINDSNNNKINLIESQVNNTEKITKLEEDNAILQESNKTLLQRIEILEEKVNG